MNLAVARMLDSVFELRRREYLWARQNPGNADISSVDEPSHKQTLARRKMGRPEDGRDVELW
jgi:hypothetical protein